MTTDEARAKAEQLVEAVRMAAYWVGYDSAGRRYDPTHRLDQDEAVRSAVEAVADAIADVSETPSPQKLIPQGELSFDTTSRGGWCSWIDHASVRESRDL